MAVSPEAAGQRAAPRIAPSILFCAGVHRLDQEHGLAFVVLVAGTVVLPRFGEALLPAGRLLRAGLPHGELLLAVPNGAAVLLEVQEVRPDRRSQEFLGRAAVLLRREEDGASRNLHREQC